MAEKPTHIYPIRVFADRCVVLVADQMVSEFRTTDEGRFSAYRGSPTDRIISGRRAILISAEPVR